MKFITIIGPQAVGKMTVGQELEKITELKLFHNHMSIDYVSNFFSYATKSGKKLVETIRKETFKEIAKSDLGGVIFTYLHNFDDESDWANLKEFCKIFEQENADIYFVELEAGLSKRLERNITPNRLNCKPLKEILKDQILN